MTQDEFQALLIDSSKKINGEIKWIESPAHSHIVEFRVQVESDSGYPLFVKGSYNRIIHTLTYALIHKRLGRIYALDLGKAHNNPDGTQVGEKHKHRWDEVFKDKNAYEPDDITEPSTNPTGVWQQFCTEASMSHDGIMNEPPPLQLEIL